MSPASPHIPAPEQHERLERERRGVRGDQEQGGQRLALRVAAFGQQAPLTRWASAQGARARTYNTVATSAALAARTVERRGRAANVVRMVPLLHSTATTSTSATIGGSARIRAPQRSKVIAPSR
ncbi:hypothetical protein [Streptomyces sp. NPDC006863]|uniref:hypothetical protein n=1 Tax=Streptomyces sp. NPDC006863 TaxID=3154779 RepID=UPI0033E5B6E5